MLLFCIFSFQNFIWFKRFLRFFPMHYFKPTQAGGSYSWGKIFWFYATPVSNCRPRPQDQTLRHFSYQIFIFMHPLFTKYCADLTKINDSNFVCEVNLKCCYSNLVRIGLVRILVCEVLNAAIFPETSKMILLFLVQMIYNRFKSFEWIPHHWLSFRAILHTLWKIAIYLTYSWLHVQQLFHFFSWAWDNELFVIPSNLSTSSQVRSLGTISLNVFDK